MSAIVLFAISLVGAVLPMYGSEVAALAAAAVAEGPLRVGLIAMAAGAQSIGKLVVYAAAAAGAKAPLVAGIGVGTLRDSIERSRMSATAVVFTSALASLPPLYATAVVCGAAGYGRLPFGVAVFAARVVRYALLVAIVDPRWIGA